MGMGVCQGESPWSPLNEVMMCVHVHVCVHVHHNFALRYEMAY